MLRVNETFLSYTEKLYNTQLYKQAIQQKVFKKGELLLLQQDTLTKVMLIKDGITKCYFTEENDRNYILEFLSCGEIIGEIEVLQNSKCLCTIEAVTDVIVYSFDLTFFKELIKSNLELSNLLLDVISKRIIDTASRASFQQLHTTDYNLKKLLELQTKQDITLSKDDMADYLGISLRNLNRALSKLKDN